MPDELSGHHLLLFRGDFNRLKELHPHDSPTSVVRQLVRKHIVEMNARGPSEVDILKETFI
jgi:hypothetical protein